MINNPVDEGTLTEGIATVDVDNDGLDDRLYKGRSTTTSVQDVLNRIDQLTHRKSSRRSDLSNARQHETRTR